MEDAVIKNATNKIVEKILNSKGKKATKKNIRKCYELYTNAINQKYHAIALDIDGTLCDSGTTLPSREIIDTIYSLIVKKIIVIFITGRGRNSAKEFIFRLRQNIVEKYNNATLDDFSKRWYCITHSGIYLLYTLNDNFDSFLASEKILVDNKLLYGANKNELNKIYTKLIKSKKIFKSVDSYEAITKEPGGIRIIFNDTVTNSNIGKVLYYIRNKIINALNLKNMYYLMYGFYKKSIAVEITLSHKGEAIKNVADFLGLFGDNILRIGDSGNRKENDYDMLASNYGFTVKSTSKNIGECFPVINYQGSILTGTEATRYIIDSLNIYPSITLPNPTKSKYYNELAYFEKRAIIHSREIQNYYSRIISASFQDKSTDIHWVRLTDVFDIKSGGVKFKDWEWNEIDSKHFIKNVFNEREKYQKSSDEDDPCFMYILKSDSSIILRGVSSYYYGIAFRNSINWQENWYMSFLLWLEKICENYDLLNIHLFDSTDRKFVLAIADNIRNVLLNILNSLLLSETNENIEIIENINMSIEANEIIKYLYENTDYIYKALFDGLYPFSMKEYFEFIKIIFNYLKINKDNVIKKILSKEYCNLRVWREADSILENIACVKDCLDQLINRKEKNNYIIYGILYGGIELPIIAKVLAKYLDICVEVKYIKIGIDYNSKHSNINYYANNKEINFKKEDRHIIMDDNIMTGKTGQIAIECLRKYNITPESIVFVRYPSLNRIPQMFFENHGAPDISLFGIYIRGLISSAPYSRIFSKNKGSNLYLDKSGIFDKSRTRLYRMIYKNGLYSNKEIIKELRYNDNSVIKEEK